jgi:predicted RNase H-like HicB family nuclease
LANAKEAIASYLGGLRLQGEPIPFGIVEEFVEV